MRPRDTDSELTTLRRPRTRTPEAETMRISRFADSASEPKVDVSAVLQSEMEDTLVERYRTLELIGRGGMGEVSRCIDTKIGREIAVKTMRERNEPGQTAGSARFLREARVQALLDHPAVVPVYDIGFDEDQRPYFTMKRIRGETLQDIFEKMRTLTKTQRGSFARHRLLSAFVTVCLAMNYAHERGVVHRDLKPDNIMLGAHGEVYVLDWGVAKVMPSRKPGAAAPVPSENTDDTRPGEMVGTPGYMSPEQVLGQLDMVDGRSDIFALGSILYELLTQEPLVPGDHARDVLEATLDAERPPPPPRDIAPELYVLCLKATRFQQEDRPQSARELAEAIERYLDGDRDQELRKKLSDERAEEAKDLASRALDGPLQEREAARARAMREAGRALALTPEHEVARTVVLRLFATPPEKMPVEAEREVTKMRDAQLTGSMRDIAIRAAVWVALFPLLIVMGPRVPWLAGVVFLLACACAGTAFFLWKRKITSSGARLGLFAMVVVYGILLSGVFGPLVFVPGFAAVNTILFGAQASKKHLGWIIALGCMTIALPLALELIGVLPSSIGVSTDSVTLLPRLTSFSARTAIAALAIVSFVGVVIPTLLAARMREALLVADEKIVLQKWHLAQLAPARLGRDG